MGKVRRNRQKYHLDARKPKVDTFSRSDVVQDESITPEQLQNIELLDIPGGLFKDFDIDMKKLEKNFDSKSIISKKSMKEIDKKMSKKERLKLRHDLWLKKIDVTKQAEKVAKEKKKTDEKMKASIVGSIQPLFDALPTFPIDVKKRKEPIVRPQRKEKSRLGRTFKQRQKDTLKDIGIFKQVLNHPEFKKDPQSTISNHIAGMLEAETNKS